MRSRCLVLAVALFAVVTTCTMVVAQPAPKPVRIGWLINTPLFQAQRAAFEAELRSAGYVPSIEIRNAEGQSSRLPALAAELVRLRVDLILASSAPPARAAKEATTEIPVVILAADPVGQGLVASLARPGANVTGLSLIFDSAFAGKWVDVLHETVPRLRRIVAFSAAEAPALERLKGMQSAATAHGVRIDPVVVRTNDDLEQALSALARQRPDAMVVDAALSLGGASTTRLREFSIRRRIPAIFASGFRVEEGGLMSYGPDFTDAYRKAARYAARILGGAKPADLPVEQATKFELVINLKTAKAIGLTIPNSVLLRADRVIE